MKKAYALLLTVLSLSGVARAQVPASPRAALDLIRKHIAASGADVSPEATGGAAKTTATLYRVSKQTDFNQGPGGLELTDSTRFRYSGLRHSAFSWYALGYITVNNLDYTPTTDFSMIAPNPTNYDSAQLSHVSFDSLIHYGLDNQGSGALLRAHTEARIYNADESVSTATVRDFQANRANDGNREVMLYNAAGRLTRVYVMTRNATSGYDTTLLRTLVYNAAGQCITDSNTYHSGGQYIPQSRNLYTYNAAGPYLTRTEQAYDFNTSAFQSYARVTNTYYASGQLRTSYQEQANAPGSPLHLVYNDSLGYTAGVPGFTSYRQLTYDTLGMSTGTYVLKTYRLTAANQLDSMTFSADFFGGLQDIYGYRLKYTAAGDVASVEAYDLQSPPDLSFAIYYTYEPYSTTNVAVPNVPATTAGFTCSPNPTTGRIDLRLAASAIGAPVTVIVTNAAGQLVHREAIASATQDLHIVLGDEAAPGMYMISMQRANGASLGSVKMMKR